MISTSPYSQRKLEFLRHFETAGDELANALRYVLGRQPFRAPPRTTFADDIQLAAPFAAKLCR